ncbi:hypothetical protein HMPREF0762_00948 [Slackia exigua ATCC 700122]|uniref:Uncharacterized protein n=1 Tax=Slackia exigua (strain ATCC 700122 / DSM 15923 / CIP 105133 / JCM 11022 / KCTC 5966 / S-7) TaxID=649764 RepID=D0WGJ4_SLAES|nr:hypothetical protein HMPREF0762_00948 [Slackia exigua ATCC 700122]
MPRACSRDFGKIRPGARTRHNIPRAPAMLRMRKRNVGNLSISPDIFAAKI